jgi:formylglycine-generating enzyme required for sulfatase activity
MMRILNIGLDSLVLAMTNIAANAAEWVADYFSFDYYTFAPSRNLPGPSAVMERGLRGGSWASPHQQVQTFFRDSSHSTQPNPRVGFRCALPWPKEVGPP